MTGTSEMYIEANSELIDKILAMCKSKENIDNWQIIDLHPQLKQEEEP